MLDESKENNEYGAEKAKIYNHKYHGGKTIPYIL